MLLLFCRAFLNINWGTKNCHAFALFQAQKRINSTVGYSKVNSHCTFYANAPLKLLVSSLKNFNPTKIFEEMKMFFKVGKVAKLLPIYWSGRKRDNA